MGSPPDRNLVITLADAAYFAGIVDGEGCIQLQPSTNKHGKTYVSARVSIDNTNLAVLERAHTLFGGSIHKKPANKWSKRQLYAWVASGNEALELCRQIVPYMIIKQNQAELLIAYCIKFTPNRYNQTAQESLSERLAMATSLSSMKHVSKSVTAVN